MLCFCSTLAIAALLAVADGQLSIKNTDFSYGQQSRSVGGKAVCISGVVQVAVAANNSKILISAPKTNAEVTELYVEFTQVNSRLATDSIGSPASVTDTYGIYSKLCLPADPASAKKVKNLQVLTHGGTLDHTYWDIAPGYSYVDTAAAAGYATLSYDRLGSGLSDHPDPVQIVQLPIQIEIAHLLVQKLRRGEIGGRTFEKVAGVGHSLGSAITQSVAAKYPKDFDALILQGTSTFFSYAFTGVASEAAQIANTDPSGRFKNLADGYHTPGPLPQTIQFAFYRYPGYDPKSKLSLFCTYSLVSLLISAQYSPSKSRTNRPTPSARCLHWAPPTPPQPHSLAL
jgi:pimeloyl-ACP methyl ester carboxylesterase